MALWKRRKQHRTTKADIVAELLKFSDDYTRSSDTEVIYNGITYSVCTENDLTGRGFWVLYENGRWIATAYMSDALATIAHKFDRAITS